MDSIFTKIRQVAVVTRDTRESVKKFADLLGVGPWDFYDFNPSRCKDMMIDGERVDYAMALAVCDIGTVQFEFCEPLEEKSLYARHLRNFGGGPQHIAYALDREYDEAVKYFASKGMHINQTGNWHGICKFNYLSNAKKLKHTVEFHLQDLDELVKYNSDRIYPEKGLDLRIEPILTGITKVGLVVKDLDDTINAYETEFGVGPWDIMEYNDSSTEDMMVYGLQVNCSYKKAVVMIGDTTIELIQPLDEKSIFAERLRLFGEGFHHITYKTENWEMAKAKFRELGIAIAQSGAYKGEEFVYYNSMRDFSHIIEIQK